MRARQPVRLLAFVVILCGAPRALSAQEPVVELFLVRHAEADTAPADPASISLSKIGRQRAAVLEATLSGTRITHLFASHTTRSLETLQPLASARHLTVLQLPERGTLVRGQRVNDTLSRREAIAPIATALRGLPAGSAAVVALNSENLFAVLHRLGVPVADSGTACAPYSQCVPCESNACYPRGAYDRLWYVVRRPGVERPVVFVELRYGTGWPVSPCDSCSLTGKPPAR